MYLVICSGVRNPACVLSSTCLKMASRWAFEFLPIMWYHSCMCLSIEFKPRDHGGSVHWGFGTGPLCAEVLHCSFATFSSPLGYHVLGHLFFFFFFYWPSHMFRHTVTPEYFVCTQFSYPGLSDLSYAWNEIFAQSMTAADSLTCFVLPFACILFSYGSRRIRNIQKYHAYEIFWIYNTWFHGNPLMLLKCSLPQRLIRIMFCAVVHLLLI